MTEEKSDRLSDEWSPLTETRDWKAVADPSRCERIARKLGKQIAEIKKIRIPDLPYVCIFKDETDG